jgi:hypothetical protein
MDGGRLDNNILKLYPQYTEVTDRRQNYQSIASDRRAMDKRRQAARFSDSALSLDIAKVNDTYKAFINNTDKFQRSVNDLDKISNKNKAVFAALSPIVPLRRISSVPDKMKDKDYAAIAGTVAVAGVLLPEDLRDMKDAGKQIFKGILPEYKFKEFQTPFSFIRGSFLEPLVNKMVNKYGYYLHEWDKSLLDTNAGKKIRNFFHVKEIDKEFTGRLVPKILKDENMEQYFKQDVKIYAKKLEGPAIGKLICRGLQRTTLYGAIILSAISFPSIVKAYNKSKNPEDKLINTGKQAIRSVVSVVSTLSGIGLGGAILAPFGPAGSVIGMGLGCVIGAYFSNKINKRI